MKCTRCGCGIPLSQNSENVSYRVDKNPVCEHCYFWDMGVFEAYKYHPPGIYSRTSRNIRTVNAKVVSSAKGTIKNFCHDQACPLCGGSGIYNAEKATKKKIMQIMVDQIAENSAEDGTIEALCAIMWGYENNYAQTGIN